MYVIKTWQTPWIEELYLFSFEVIQNFFSNSAIHFKEYDLLREWNQMQSKEKKNFSIFIFAVNSREVNMIRISMYTHTHLGIIISDAYVITYHWIWNIRRNFLQRNFCMSIKGMIFRFGRSTTFQPDKYTNLCVHSNTNSKKWI